jgi:hypothetical protein
VTNFQESPGCSRHPTRRKVGRQHPRVAAQPPAIPVFFVAFLVCWGESPSPSHSRAFIPPPPFTQVLTIPCRPTLRIFFVIYEASGCAIGATSLRTHLAAKANWLSNGVLPFVMTSTPHIGFLMECGWD